MMRCNRRTSSYLFAITIFLLIVPFQAQAQSEYLENGTNGTGLTISSFFDSGGFESVGFSAGFSIAGILDLGLGMDVVLDELEGYDSREINGHIFYNVFVLKQDNKMPLSMQIIGSYGLTTVSSGFLDNNNLIKRGWGLTIGAKLSRDLMITHSFGFRLGAFFFYKWYRFTIEFTIEEEIPTTTETWPGTEEKDALYYGGLLSLLFKTSHSGPILSTTFEGMLDPDLNFRMGPKFTVTQPIR